MLHTRAASWDPMQHAIERLEAAVADRRGSAEEITALFVALLRSHGLAVRFVRCAADCYLALHHLFVAAFRHICRASV